tara:strand:+ start:2207 stop:3811 length:1605 start_codon:yes stop_codon:yes gene_type:complete
MTTPYFIGTPRAVVMTADVPGLRAVESMYFVDGMIARINIGNFYEWDSTNLAADDGTNVIKPDDIGVLAPGRWLLTTLGGGGGGGGGIPTKDDKSLVPLVTVGDNATTGITISTTPVGDGYVTVRVNGTSYELGDADKTKDCYFSVDGGATARAIAAIVVGDTLYWNGVLAGFDLAITDEVDLDYDIGGPGIVVGPGASTDEAIARWDGATGALLQDSLTTLDDLGNVTMPGGATISGVDVTAHEARHRPGGADAIPTAVPVDVGVANASGTAASFARSDHVHNHANLPGGPHHAIATPATAGFESAADKTKLDGIEAGADVTGALNVAAAGAVMDSDFIEPEGFMRKTGVGTYEAIKANMSAAVNPAITDDSASDYAVGSRWFNTTTDQEFVCLDASVGAAVWISTTVSQLRNITTDATQTEVFLDGSSTQMVLRDDTTWCFSLLIVARRTDATGDRRSWRLDGMINRDTGVATTTIDGTPLKTAIAATAGAATWDVDVAADTTNGALQVLVTGEVAKTIRWSVCDTQSEVTG